VVEVHDEVADRRIRGQKLTVDVGLVIADDTIDVAKDARDVAVDVENAWVPGSSGNSISGKFTAPVDAPVFTYFVSATATSRPMASCASTVEPPTCGVRMTFGNP